MKINANEIDTPSRILDSHPQTSNQISITDFLQAGTQHAIFPTVLLQRAKGNEVIQCIKKYNHSKKLYVNDEDAEPAPPGYVTVSKFFYDTDSDEWTVEREPSRYYVGAGGLGGPESFLSTEISDHSRHPSIRVTTFESRQTERGLHPEYDANEESLGQMGAGPIAEKVDATDPRTMSPTRYDEVHFEFPHTGVYGGDEERDQRCRASNEELMRRSMAALGPKKLRPGGRLRISEGGFPYRDSMRAGGRREGMDLDRIAQDLGYTARPSSPLGTRTIGRTIGGEPVRLPNSTRHNYVAPSMPPAEGVLDTLMAPTTHWLQKREMVRRDPTLIFWVRNRGEIELGDLLEQYYNMDDGQIDPGVLAAYYGR